MPQASEKNAQQALLRPEILQTLKGLSLLSRQMVGAFLNGMHQSRRAGEGAEFRQYRAYQPGDDLRRLDWKMYARSDRFYIREADTETHLHVRLVLDRSASMRHEDQNRLSKLDFARLVAASLAYLAQLQGDRVSLWVLPVEPRPAQVLSGAASRDGFRALLYALLQVQAEGQFPLLPPDLPQKPGEGREMIVFISDLYQAQDEMVQCLRRWRKQQHEVICLHLLAQNELTLDYGQDARFEDWETGQRKTVHLASARTQYLENLQTQLQALRQAVLAQQVEYASFGMHEALEQVFRLFLERRKRLL